MGMIYRSFDKMDATKRQALLSQGDWLLEHLDEL